MMSSMSSSTYSPRPTTTPLLALTSLVMMLILRHCLMLKPGLRLIQARGKGSSFSFWSVPGLSRKRGSIRQMALHCGGATSFSW